MIKLRWLAALPSRLIFVDFTFVSFVVEPFLRPLGRRMLKVS